MAVRSRRRPMNWRAPRTSAVKSISSGATIMAAGGRLWRSAVVLCISCVLAAPVSAQDFPLRPLRLIASEAGGGGDFAARLIAQGLAGILGQPVVVENHGGGVIAGELVARAPADGHTLLLYGNT